MLCTTARHTLPFEKPQDPLPDWKGRSARFVQDVPSNTWTFLSHPLSRPPMRYILSASSSLWCKRRAEGREMHFFSALVPLGVPGPIFNDTATTKLPDKEEGVKSGCKYIEQDVTSWRRCFCGSSNCECRGIKCMQCMLFQYCVGIVAHRMAIC